MALQTRYSLSIPNPCNQNWDQMTVSGNEKYCSSCEKVIADLSKLSDEELILRIQEAGKGLCGRITPGQLHRVLYTTQVNKPNSLFLTGMTAGLLLAGLPEGYTQNTEDKGHWNYHSPSDSTVKTPAPKDTNVQLLQGRVVDKLTKTPIPGTIVFLNGTDKGAVTDSGGYFQLSIPANIPNPVYVQLTYLGYETQTLSLVSGKMEQIELLEEAFPLHMVGAIVIEEHGAKYFFHHPFHWFRHKWRKWFR
jgi:hypothetical protein